MTFQLVETGQTDEQLREGAVETTFGELKPLNEFIDEETTLHLLKVAPTFRNVPKPMEEMLGGGGTTKPAGLVAVVLSGGPLQGKVMPIDSENQKVWKIVRQP